METLARRTEPTDSPAATAGAASCPSWVLLHRDSYGRVDTARTSAASSTSVGRPFRVSFGLTPPPAISSFFVDWAGSTQGDGDFVGGEHCIVAAHGDSILLHISVPNHHHDYFVYEAGAARPPWLRLLPTCFFPMQFQRGESPAFRRPAGPRVFLDMITGVLRRGEGGEILVAQLDLQPRQRDDSGKALPVAAVTAELCVLRGRGEWELLERVPIVVDDDELRKDKALLWWWETDAVVPAGDRYLCFVDYIRGFLLYDTAEEEEEEPGGPKLRYVPLPVAVPWGNPDQDDWGRPRMQSSRNLACAGAGDVRFVSVEPRCCCGGPGKSTCARSTSAFTVTTWTLSLAGGGPLAAAAWVKDGVLDCEELWALLGDEGLPRGVRPEFPVVSSDDPDVVCFVVGSVLVKDRGVWMVEVDTRRKTLRSVVPFTDEWQPYYRVPAKLQC